MGIDLLFGCAQVETVVRNIEATRDFLVNVLGAGKIEQQLAQEISALFPGGEHKMEHLGCGDAVFQLNETSPAAGFRGQIPIHLEYLQRLGPCVTNLNYFVDDAIHATELFTEMGAKIHLQGPSDVAPCLADYGENTSVEKRGNFYFAGSKELIGFDLEYMNPNFKRFSLQSVQYPAFVYPRPPVGNRTVRLMHLRVIVKDLEQTYSNLRKLFLPACRSKPYKIRYDKHLRAFRICLGGMEIEYRQPALERGGPEETEEYLDRYGSGISAVVFGTRDIPAILSKAENYPLVSIRDEVGNGERENRKIEGSGWLIGCRELTGFDVCLRGVSDAVFKGVGIRG